MGLKKILCSEPVMAYPRGDRTYALIVDASTGTADIEGGMGAILAQIDKNGVFHALSYASKQLIKHEKTTHHTCSKWMLWYGQWSTTKNT